MFPELMQRPEKLFDGLRTNAHRKILQMIISWADSESGTWWYFDEPRLQIIDLYYCCFGNVLKFSMSELLLDGLPHTILFVEHPLICGPTRWGTLRKVRGSEGWLALSLSVSSAMNEWRASLFVKKNVKWRSERGQQKHEGMCN